MTHVNISERSLVVGVLGILSLKFIIYKLVEKIRLYLTSSDWGNYQMFRTTITKSSTEYGESFWHLLRGNAFTKEILSFENQMKRFIRCVLCTIYIVHELNPVMHLCYKYQNTSNALRLQENPKRRSFHWQLFQPKSKWTVEEILCPEHTHTLWAKESPANTIAVKQHTNFAQTSKIHEMLGSFIK